MVNTHRALHVGILAAALLAAAPVATHAESGRAAGAHAGAPFGPMSMDVYGGVVRMEDGGDDMAPGFGAAGFLLGGPFQVGLSTSLETQMFGYHRIQLASHAGLRARLARFEVDAAGTLGVAWMDAGADFLGDDPGASGGIAFAGGRLGANVALYLSDDGKKRLGLGPIVNYEHDLSPYDVTYTYTSTPWISFNGDAEPTEQTSTVRIGRDRAALLLAFTVGFE